MNDDRTERARELRTASSMPERVLWNALRNRQLSDAKFRRQVPFGKFVVDFYCSDHSLVIEIDGRHHDQQVEYDRARDRWLREQGLRVVRISASDVSRDLNTVLERVVAEMRTTPPPHPAEG